MTSWRDKAVEMEETSAAFSGVVASSADFASLAQDDLASLLSSHGIFVDGAGLSQEECVTMAREHFLLYHPHVFGEQELAGVDVEEIRSRHGELGECHSKNPSRWSHLCACAFVGRVVVV